MQLDGQYVSLACCVVSLENKFSRHGASPAAHLGDGCLDLVLLPRGSHCRILSHFIRVAFTKHHVSAGVLKP